MHRLNTRFARTMVVSLIFLILFIIFMSGFIRSITDNEALTLSILQDDMRAPHTLRETARYIRDSLLNTWRAPQSQGIQAIYYLALDAWSLLVGVSDFTLRVFPVLMSMLGLACIYAIVKKISSFRIGIFIVLSLGIGGFVINQYQAIPDWQSINNQANDKRSVDEPALINMPTPSPLAYYAENGLLEGISINIGWRSFTPQEIVTLGNTFENRQRAWVIADISQPASWDAVAVLSNNRGVHYRDALSETILYQFDETSNEQLSFTFNDNGESVFAYIGDLMTVYESSTQQELCIPLALEVVTDYTSPYSIEINLLDMTDTPITSTTATLSPSTIGTVYTEEHCLTLPETASYRLQLLIQNTQGQALSVLEATYRWGNFMIIGSVVDNDS